MRRRPGVRLGVPQGGDVMDHDHIAAGTQRGEVGRGVQRAARGPERAARPAPKRARRGAQAGGRPDHAVAIGSQRRQPARHLARQPLDAADLGTDGGAGVDRHQRSGDACTRRAAGSPVSLGARRRVSQRTTMPGGDEPDGDRGGEPDVEAGAREADRGGRRVRGLRRGRTGRRVFERAGGRGGRRRSRGPEARRGRRLADAGARRARAAPESSPSSSRVETTAERVDVLLVAGRSAAPRHGRRGKATGHERQENPRGGVGSRGEYGKRWRRPRSVAALEMRSEERSRAGSEGQRAASRGSSWAGGNLPNRVLQDLLQAQGDAATTRDGSC